MREWCSRNSLVILARKSNSNSNSRNSQSHSHSNCHSTIVLVLPLLNSDANGQSQIIYDIINL